jgi:hypothetical protein
VRGDGAAEPVRIPPEQCHRLQGKSILAGDGCPCFVVGHVEATTALVQVFRPCPAAARKVLPRGSGGPPVLRKPPPPAILLGAPGNGRGGKSSEMTGELCGECGAFAMIRTGTCLTCQMCGGTSGGCS